MIQCISGSPQGNQRADGHAPAVAKFFAPGPEFIAPSILDIQYRRGDHVQELKYLPDLALFPEEVRVAEARRDCAFFEKDCLSKPLSLFAASDHTVVKSAVGNGCLGRNRVADCQEASTKLRRMRTTMSRQPKRDLRRKQQRQRKVRHLHARLEQTNDSQRRQRLIAKIKKISPGSPVPAR